MRTSHSVSFYVVSILLVLLAPSFGCEDKKPAAAGAEPAAPASAASPANAALVRVEVDKVCMINDRFMDAPQIPVVVEGKTYYGCCPMCEKRLKEQADSRFGVDPVSKKRVDKAGAVIGKLPSGKVLYFENAQTFSAYKPQT